MDIDIAVSWLWCQIQVNFETLAVDETAKNVSATTDAEFVQNKEKK